MERSTTPLPSKATPWFSARWSGCSKKDWLWATGTCANTWRSRDTQSLRNGCTDTYGACEEGPRSKSFPNESFGLLRVTAERPLGLRWVITDDTLFAVATDKEIARLPALSLYLVVEKLRDDQGDTYHAQEDNQDARTNTPVSVICEEPAPLVNAITNALAVRGPDAPVITDSKGNPQPDPQLRDYENVPLPTKRVDHETDTTRRLDTIKYGPPSTTTSNQGKDYRSR